MIKKNSKLGDLNAVEEQENTEVVKLGSSCRFVYPEYGTPDTHPDYTEHSGCAVMIVCQLTLKECSAQPSYQIVASDGWKGTAHASELHSL